MPINLTVRNRIAEILFDQPPVNAFDTKGWESIPDLVWKAAADEDVRCILIRAEGKGFCGGVDIKEMAAHPERIAKLNRDNYLTFKAIRECAIPVVGALHGFVIGGGVNIAGACDCLIAAEGAYFSLPEIDRGAMGGAAFMSRMLPVQMVRANFFTGGRIPVEDAFRHGSVHKIVPADRLKEEAYALCDVIASKSRAALVIAKQALNLIEPSDPSANYRIEQGFTLEMYMNEDSQKARDAFADGKATAKF
ncbi:enoyl-CoA hydratase family protein [Novosphingobium sp. P6W]|uniref:enoyl-CoA hydratase family protein n=1 Tax=Novosphingobium sp. P6W TaxID=1609758 RepID=UPI0005C306CE|nr:enoyl-CoA hydratase family protein [Novosphingobium sp. P6W]AXB80283.1 enoyl-CoA hydratase family protein [Novosphingobium sp. P6W]KIS31618.1 enoyl-CoA hydratase [Novosphingobium sp. P6W]